MASAPRRRLGGMLVRRVDLVPAGDNPMAKVGLWKSKDTKPQNVAKGGEGNMPDNPVKKGLPEEIRKSLEEAQVPEEVQKTLDAAFEAANKTADEAVAKAETVESEVGELRKELAELKKDDAPADTLQELRKSNPQLAAELDRIEKERKEDRERLEKAEEIAKAERDKRVTKEYVEVAKSFTAIGADPAELGPVLKSASEKLTEDEYKKIEQALRSADEVAKAGRAFEVIGNERAGVSSAFGKIEKAAEKLQETDPKMTKEEAIDQVYSTRPDLVQEYQREMREGVGN